MNKCKVTFKRVIAFYESILVEASTEGGFERESDLLDDDILDIEKL
jgi:hypothetical protein